MYYVQRKWDQYHHKSLNHQGGFQNQMTEKQVSYIEEQDFIEDVI